MRKPVATIENWAVLQSASSEVFEDLDLGNCLTGHVLGHANLPSTTIIYTSPIVSFDLSQGVVETRNTIYRLGEASDEYKSWERRRKASAA
jgi:hypothetical protein